MHCFFTNLCGELDSSTNFWDGKARQEIYLCLNIASLVPLCLIDTHPAYAANTAGQHSPLSSCATTKGNDSQLRFQLNSEVTAEEMSCVRPAPGRTMTDMMRRDEESESFETIQRVVGAGEKKHTEMG